jgi:nitrogen fixation/metabolism regulation signal transduction histidine kinase
LADDRAALVRWARTRAGAAIPPTRREPERIGDRIAVVAVAGADTVIFARELPPALSRSARESAETVGLLRAFREERPAVLRSYVVPFLLSYALLLGVAVAVGVVLAGRIARPMEALVRGAGRVGSGDLGTRVDVQASGEVADLVAAFNRMVADLDAQQAELVRLERVAAWRDLARSLAHEIKNPLTPIQLAVQQLGDSYRGEGEYAKLLGECVEIVDEEVEALRRLVREFSEFARLPEPDPVPGDLSSLLDELGRLYGERVEHPASAPVPAHFDEAELKRALINLVDNGIAACAAAGRPERVRLEAVRTAAGAEIRVTDAGCGVPEANLARIFEPNFSTKTEGMGLGLAIVEGIVRGHGGTIAVASREGEGTTFTIRLLATAGSREESSGGDVPASERGGTQ